MPLAFTQPKITNNVGIFICVFIYRADIVQRGMGMLGKISLPAEIHLEIAGG
jgi:hypothetical protein